MVKIEKRMRLKSLMESLLVWSMSMIEFSKKKSKSELKLRNQYINLLSNLKSQSINAHVVVAINFVSNVPINNADAANLRL